MHPMHPMLVLGLRAALGVAVAAVLWHTLGPVGLVLSAPLFGLLLAKPLLETAGALWRSSRWLAWRGVEGRHHVHHGIALDVIEDDRHHRWLRVHDVRRCVPGLPRDEVLCAQFPQAMQQDVPRVGWRIRADGLRAWLDKAGAAESIRFRNWLDREVIHPSAERRRRAGFAPSPPPPPQADPPA